MQKNSLDRRYEHQLSLDYSIVIGVDEAGRGPLAGPVVIGAFIAADDFYIDGVMDSKKIGDISQREHMYTELTSNAKILWDVCIMTHDEIDQMNILQATLTGMSKVVHSIIKKYHLKDLQKIIALVDGNHEPKDMPTATKCIIKGDSSVYSIAAASIIAKVTRDRIMAQLDEQYPLYKFAQHKGYPTAEHRMLLMKHGACEIHRKTYRPVADAMVSHHQNQIQQKKKRKTNETNEQELAVHLNSEQKILKPNTHRYNLRRQVIK